VRTAPLFAVYCLLCLLWSSSWLAIKVSLHGVEPIMGAGLRTLVAASVFFLFVLARRQTLRVPRESWTLVAVTGLFVFTIPYGLVYVGETQIASGLTGLLYGSLPMFAAMLAARMLPNEPLTATKFAGAVVGLAGLGLVFKGSLSIDGSAAAVLAMCGIVAAAGSQSFAQVKAKQEVQPPIPVLLAWAMGIGAILLMSLALLVEPAHVDLDARTLGSIAYLALGGSVLGFAMNYWLLPRIGALTLGLIYQITPLLALLQGWALYNETINLPVVIGAIVVAVGISLASGVVGAGRSLRPTAPAVSRNDPL
jgi:drug/metabolite transporter (DMT)-like permease